MKSILVPYCTVKTDYAAADSGVIVFSEVYDMEPNINALAESTLWLQGGHLDSRTVRIQLEIHGDMLKFGDYSEVVSFIRKGDIMGLVRDKIGQNMVDYLDLLARNAFADVPANYKTFGSDAANRAGIAADDYLTLDQIGSMRDALEDLEIPGVAAVTDQDIKTLVMTTTPRVVSGIRKNNLKWHAAQEYAGSQRLFNGETGEWDGVRFVRTNRLRLYNAGAVIAQDTLNGATVPGQGAARTVDSVYTVGQSTATPYITVADETGFTVGMNVTIHDNALGAAVLETDGTAETRRVVEVDTVNHRLKFNKPLMKAHGTGDYVTNGRDVHLSVLHGGPSVVYGVAEAPHPISPPKFDDLMMVNRFGWRGFLKFQQFRPEYIQVNEASAPTA
jgi:N4-gp56 family major capsid protein